MEITWVSPETSVAQLFWISKIKDRIKLSMDNYLENAETLNKEITVY